MRSGAPRGPASRATPAASALPGGGRPGGGCAARGRARVGDARRVAAEVDVVLEVLARLRRVPEARRSRHPRYTVMAVDELRLRERAAPTDQRPEPGRLS